MIKPNRDLIPVHNQDNTQIFNYLDMVSLVKDGAVMIFAMDYLYPNGQPMKSIFFHVKENMTGQVLALSKIIPEILEYSGGLELKFNPLVNGDYKIGLIEGYCLDDLESRIYTRLHIGRTYQKELEIIGYQNNEYPEGYLPGSSYFDKQGRLSTRWVMMDFEKLMSDTKSFRGENEDKTI